MILYLIRHAHALAATEDPLRPLSKKGRKQVKALAEFLTKREALAVREVWHSPLARSVETAERLVKELGLNAKLVEVRGIENDDEPQIIARKLTRRRQPLAIVGHDPHLTALLTLLLTGKPDPARFILKKCAAVALEYVNGVWALRWQVSPEIVA